MQPEQALQILDSTVADVHFPRCEHVRLQEAVRVLAELILAVRKSKTKAPDGGKADGTDT